MRLQLHRRLAHALTPAILMGVIGVTGLSAATTADAPPAPTSTSSTTTQAPPPPVTLAAPLSADEHDSEVSLPPVPSLPPRIQVQTTTTTTIPGYSRADCPQIWSLAVDVGWPEEWLPRLDEIVWAESRCQHDVISSTYDYGWTQINWAAHGDRLTANGLSREALLVPVTNLTEALWIAQYAAEHYGCWSQPWYMSGDWC
jgi:hypothetical protein